MSRMRVVQVSSANGPFEMVERDVPTPASRQVRIKVEACGICHSDLFTKIGAFPGMQFPRVPGHEVVGVLDAVGSEVPEWKVGVLSHIRPLIETYALERASEAYERMMSGKARFRVVLTMNPSESAR
jgi:D-arabinose 1-dehydrogenase-like Zn-dependent alcohol dehydrogenase